LSVPQFRPVQRALARRDVPVLRLSARLSGRPRSEALSVHRDAAAPSSYLRQAAGRPSAALSEPARWQVPAAAWRQPAAAARVMASPSEMKAAAVAE
jgi:hypothetical protein